MERNLSTTDQILRYARYRGNTIEEGGIVQVLGKAKIKVEQWYVRHNWFYSCFITGYMFRPTYGSSSGLLTGESVNAMRVGIPSCS
jgi:hypothetical protein